MAVALCLMAVLIGTDRKKPDGMTDILSSTKTVFSRAETRNKAETTGKMEF